MARSTNKWAVSMDQPIAAGAKVDIKYQLPKNAMIQEIQFLPYQGQERSLRVYPYILYEGNLEKRPLLHQGVGAVTYLAGDGLPIHLPIGITGDQGDYILVHVENISDQVAAPGYDYDLDLKFILLDLGGVN